MELTSIMKTLAPIMLCDKYGRRITDQLWNQLEGQVHRQPHKQLQELIKLHRLRDQLINKLQEPLCDQLEDDLS